MRPGRERRWSFDDAIEALDNKLRALGARHGIASEPIAILPGTGVTGAGCPGDIRAPEGEAWGTAARSGVVEGAPSVSPSDSHLPGPGRIW